MKKFLPVFLAAFLLLTISSPSVPVRAETAAAPALSTASDLIYAVNALRATYGLAPYTSNSILMSIAQTHAEYLASIGVSNTHIDSYGRSPYQRALDAGYPVAGDLRLGGWFSENVIGGAGLSVQGAMEWWINSSPHLNTMISTNLSDIGAGVAVVGNTYYYVLDCGLSTGGTPVVYTPPAYITYPTAIQPTNTPNADGTITYIVQKGDTALGIAIAYNISLTELLARNGLTEKSVIYPGQKIIIVGGYTPTPTQPTPTATIRHTITSWPTSTSTTTATPFPPTPTRLPALPVSQAKNAVFLIVGAALAVAALLALLGRRQK
jgi:uncharacterized protein YkwD